MLAPRQTGFRYRSGWGMAGLLLFLSLYGEGVAGQMKKLEENISDILWLTNGKPLMQTSYMPIAPKIKKNVV